MLRWFIVAMIVALVPTLVSAVPLTLTDDEKVMLGTQAKGEWRLEPPKTVTGEDADQTYKSSVYKDTLYNTGKYPNMADRIKAFQDAVNKGLTKKPVTALNPFLVVNPPAKNTPDGKAVVTYESNANNELVAVALKIGEGVLPADLTAAKTALKVEDEQPSGAGKAYKIAGTWYRFDDIKFNFYYQIKPGEKERSDDLENSGKYAKKVSAYDGEGTYQLGSHPGSPEYYPTNYFDPGVNRSDVNQAVDLAAGGAKKGDVRMQVVVVLEGKVATGASPDALTTVKDIKDFGTECKQVCSFYVEDYTPPLPDEASVSSIDVKAFSKPGGIAKNYAFAIPSLQHHNADGTGASLGKDPNSVPIPPYAYPNGDSVNRDNYPGSDYTWQSLMMKADNPKDDALNKTLNYEVGLSMGNRVKYVNKDKPADRSQYRYMYFVPPLKAPDGHMVGPYLGRVQVDSKQKVGMGYDKYNINEDLTVNGETVQKKEYLDPFYAPVCYRDGDPNLHNLVNFVMAESGDAGEVLQQKKKESGFGFGPYKDVAGISVKWGRECVQGITLGGSLKDDPELKIPPYQMLLPFGFSSYENPTGDRFRSMEPEDNPDVDNPTPGIETPKSLVGTNAEGSASPDSFFKVNAADCCSNDVVIASGTYGTEDNVKPTPLLKLEEKDVRAGFEKPLAEVATIPNGPSGAGDPLGEYNYDIPVSRIHPASVPLYPEGGSGVQGKDFKGYGNYSNNADVWDGWGQFQTLQNPSDAKGASFLNVRLAQNEPPIEEDRRVAVTIAADDNITPVVEMGETTSPEGTVRYNIAYLGYNFYYTEQKNGQLGQPIMGGTVVNLDPKTTPANDPAWTKEPKVTFDYNFRRPGFYVVEITAIDRSANKRVMRVPVQIARLSSSFKAIDVEGRRQ